MKWNGLAELAEAERVALVGITVCCTIFNDRTEIARLENL